MEIRFWNQQWKEGSGKGKLAATNHKYIPRNFSIPISVEKKLLIVVFCKLTGNLHQVSPRIKKSNDTGKFGEKRNIISEVMEGQSPFFRVNEEVWYIYVVLAFSYLIMPIYPFHFQCHNCQKLGKPFNRGFEGTSKTNFSYRRKANSVKNKNVES